MVISATMSPEPLSAKTVIPAARSPATGDASLTLFP